MSNLGQDKTSLDAFTAKQAKCDRKREPTFQAHLSS